MATVSTCQWSRTAWCIAARLPTCATSESEIEVSDGVKPDDQVVLTLRPVDLGDSGKIQVRAPAMPRGRCVLTAFRSRRAMVLTVASRVRPHAADSLPRLIRYERELDIFGVTGATTRTGGLMPQDRS